MIPPDHSGMEADLLAIEAPAARARRVARIQDQLESGEYHVPAADVADAVVAHFSRELCPPGCGDTGFSAESC